QWRLALRAMLLGLALLLLGNSNCLQAQQIDWISFEELPARMRDEARPVLIFLKTDWCKFCALQKENTFSDSTVVAQINEHYYALQLNGESQATIRFLNRDYHYEATGTQTGQHQLAAFLGTSNGQLSYPTTVLLSDRMQLLHRVPGFISAAALGRLLNIRIYQNANQ
ncbi:MAG: thioredoxin family protein, partial [Bacteroidota bacterium]